MKRKGFYTRKSRYVVAFKKTTFNVTQELPWQVLSFDFTAFISQVRFSVISAQIVISNYPWLAPIHSHRSFGRALDWHVEIPPAPSTFSFSPLSFVGVWLTVMIQTRITYHILFVFESNNKTTTDQSLQLDDQSPYGKTDQSKPRPEA